MLYQVLGSIVVSIPACHAGDRGSIPRRGVLYFFIISLFMVHDFIFYLLAWAKFGSLIVRLISGTFTSSFII